MPLSGSELHAKARELSDVSKSDLVRSCGYMSTKKDGAERLNYTAYYQAPLEAKGVNLRDGKGNRLVDKAYTAILGLEPSDEFEIKLDRKQIKRIPAGGEEERGPWPSS